ncbi:MAG: hypothetical protein OEU33_15995, partial [Chromatiales bacterium]|nr:hypothetical protein [Chromatiales bacterium]
MSRDWKSVLAVWSVMAFAMLVGAGGNAGETATSVADAAENEGPFKSITVNIDRQKLFAWADNELIF